MATSSSHTPSRFALAYARIFIRHPGKVLLVLVALAVAAGFAASHLTINSNQLDLISQDLIEVKDVKKVIDMVGGAGYLMLGIRGQDEKTLKGVADDLAAQLTADKENVRFVTYKLPVDFIQKNMVLFIKPEDLDEGRKRINAYVKATIRKQNPFMVELRKTKPPVLNLDDLIAKYGHVGKKSILDDYQISNDHQMILLLVKPMWDSNQIDRTEKYLVKLTAMIQAYGKNNKYGISLAEDYKKDLYLQNPKTYTYGYTGSYKTSVDDSYAIVKSLGPVTLIALVAIILITIVFFRKLVPTVIVISGTALGTILTMGFTYITVHQLNMVTSILGGILLGFGVDYGIHFIFRTRIELGSGKPYDVAIQDALINAGRPASVAAVVTGGSFFMLLFSNFRGFSQFGLVAGVGTMLIGLTLFSWAPAILSILGRINPELPKRLVGEMKPPSQAIESGDIRVPKPKLVLGIAAGVVLLICALAVPWSSAPLSNNNHPRFSERITHGIRFNYNTRALQAEDQYSVVMQDEISRRFNISADPIAVVTDNLADTKVLYDELTQHPEKYTTVDQVVSIYTFVPPPEIAKRNEKILVQWKEDLKDIDVDALPADMQDKAKRFQEILAVKPFDVNGVPEIYRNQFRELPTSHYKGWLTFIYPGIDLWDGKKMLEFADQTRVIHAGNGQTFRAAGLPILFAILARMVLGDGYHTVIAAFFFILMMHWLDFRSIKLALASVIPLVVGLFVMLGLLTLFNQRLNFMNIIILPILLGFGVSHGLYLLHRFLEGTSPMVAFRSVGAAVASSTLTAIAGFGALMFASHQGLKSMGVVACMGLATTLIVSFTVFAAVLQLMHDQRVRQGAAALEASKADGKKGVAA